MRSVAAIHTSSAAIAPVNAYYRAHAPDFELTNLLDDGMLRCFPRGEEPLVEGRLRTLLNDARQLYGGGAAVVTPVLNSLSTSLDGPKACLNLKPGVEG